MSAPEANSGPILHVIVVGFHHKRGCQVDYSYPPLIEGNPVDSHELPEEWKYLPPLALPDGAHNTTEDTIFFHMPSRNKLDATVFGISCYRQIDAHELLHRENDVTRNTVQKSVCVLSTIPLYGLIKAKLELITHAYFKERDFSQVSLLEETFINLNASLTPNLAQGSQAFLGMSGRDVIQNFKHKVLMLFKLILLERRVLFFTAPVEPICSAMLTILSLFPGMIESGMMESASYSPDQYLSSQLKVAKVNNTESDDFLEVHYSNRDPSPQSKSPCTAPCNTTSNHNAPHQNVPHHNATPSSQAEDTWFQSSPQELVHSVANKQSSPENSESVAEQQVTSSEPARDSFLHGRQKQKVGPQDTTALQRSFSLEEDVSELKTDKHMEELLEAEDCFNWNEDKLLLEIDDALMTSDVNQNPSPNTVDAGRLHERSNLNKSEQTTSKDSVHSVQMSSSSSSNSISGKPSKDKRKKDKRHKKRVEDERPPSRSTLTIDQYGFPLSIFTKGNLCHPYLCLQYYDLLSDINVRGFVIGATNQLFKRKKHLIDVVVEIAEARLDVHDPELRKQLTPTTADLRFADFLVQTVSDDRGDIFLDDTEWEGGDEWIRGQFRNYLVRMLATIDSGEKLMIDDFNSSFVAAWRTTHNYKVWTASRTADLKDTEPVHPCHGQLSMSDMKLKISHSMQSTERGKKINAAVQQTGKVMYNTTKVVGGALNSAKSAVSSWFSGLGTTSTTSSALHTPVTETPTSS